MFCYIILFYYVVLYYFILFYYIALCFILLYGLRYVVIMELVKYEKLDKVMACKH